MIDEENRKQKFKLDRKEYFFFINPLKLAI